jgi:Bacterial extracellular solute-binding protein
MAVKRLLALIAAALLIAGAIVLRSTMDDTSADASDGSSTGSDANGTVITCAPDLADECRATARKMNDLAVIVEDVTTTLDRIAAGEQVDSWVTFAPLERLAVGPDGQPYFGTPTPLASSPLAIVMPTDRATVLAAACDITWRCIGENAGDAWSDIGGPSTWGDLTAGHDDPARRALGLAVMGAAASSFFGGTGFNSTDIDADPDFFGWFSRLERSAPPFVVQSDSALAALVTRPGLSLVGTSGEEIAAIESAQLDRFTVTYPEPMVRAQAVLASRAGVDVSDEITGGLSETLLDSGWEAPGDGATGLPSAGALRTLLDLWRSFT